MSTAATVISTLGTYDWNARVYNVLALASQLAAAVNHRGHGIRVAYHLRNLNNSVSEFVTIVNESMEGKRKPIPKSSAGYSSDTPIERG